MIKNKKNILFVLLFIFAFIVNPMQAHANWFEFFFPFAKHIREANEAQRQGKMEEDAIERQQQSRTEQEYAPFANPDVVIEEFDLSGNEENTTPLHKRHRTNAVMTQWVQTALPNILAYQAQDYQDQYEEKAKLFSEVGLKEYQKFLEDRSYFKTLQTGRYDIAGIFEDYPLVLNEGEVDGQYRWLYRVNILITYYDNTATIDSINDTKSSITQRFELTFQLGRHRHVDNEHGVLIESWTATPR
ncbi:MAG: hypothetical protein GC137_08105 [Alphaproteobacteria bacterium]|nr:hypothetical protein [Alphaproteobacteria bacterium]